MNYSMYLKNCVNLRIKLFSINKNKSYKSSILKCSSKIRICDIYREMFLRERLLKKFNYLLNNVALLSHTTQGIYRFYIWEGSTSKYCPGKVKPRQSPGWISRWEGRRRGTSQHWSQDENSIIPLVNLESVLTWNSTQYIVVSKKKFPKQPLKGKMFQVKRTIFLWGNYFITKYCLTTKRVSGLMSIANKDLYSHRSLILCFPGPGNTFLHLLIGNWNF